MDPKPPQRLNAEMTGVWLGWTKMKDREVVREAATKGVHLSLAHTFLANRRQWDLNAAENWFSAEVRTWALQLLMQRQIFKATHILSNIGLDPYQEFIDVLKDTKDDDLRNYLAEHLIKTKKIDSYTLSHWKFLKLLKICDKNTISNWNDDFKNHNISDISQCSKDWKADIATQLYFNYFDVHISSFLEPIVMWKYLLANNKINLLHCWIHCFFGDSQACSQIHLNYSTENKKELKDLFSKSVITSDMINEIIYCSSADFTIQYILIELSHYGIFIERDLSDFVVILSYFARSENIQNINNILMKPTSTLTVSHFNQMLIEFCLHNNLFNLLVSYFQDHQFSEEIVLKLNSESFDLWILIRQMFENSSNTNLILKSILKTCQFLSQNDLDGYFIQHPIIFLSLLMFDNSYQINKCLTADEGIVIENITFQKDFMQKLFENVKVIKNIETKLEATVTEDVTLYQLLSNYKQLDMTKVFGFRFSRFPIPNFTSEYFVQKYGHREKLKFTDYLLQGRCSIASKLFIMDSLQKLGKITKKSKAIASNKVYGLALANYNNMEITTACISFLEMIGMDSNILRLHITVANIISEKFVNVNIESLFQNITDNKSTILKLLEEALLTEETSNFSARTFVEILIDWESAVHFAAFHNLDYPQGFLKHCANNNLWMYFVIFIQYHKYPIECVLNLVDMFENAAIREHMKHSLAYDLYTNEEKKKRRLKERDSRRSLYSRIGVKQSDTSSRSFSSTSSGDSIDKSDISEPQLHEMELIYEIHSCHKSSDSANSLLSAAIKYQNPIFSVFATFYEPKSIVVCWLTWLYSSTGCIEENLLPHKRLILPDTVEKYLEQAIRSGFVSTVAESFNIFLPENPLCSFVIFLSECTKYLHHEISLKHLKVFKTIITYMQFTSVTPESNTEITYLTNRNWLASMAVKLVCYTIAYGFRSKHHQKLFIKTLCSQAFSSDLNVKCPDFEHLNLLLDVVANSNVMLNFAAILQIQHSVEAKEIEIQRCVTQLIHNKEFETALALCQLEHINVDHVLIEKWKFEFQKRDNIKLFWENCEKSLRESRIGSITAAKFYINVADSIENILEKYLVLKLAFGWLKECNSDEPEIQMIEAEMWCLYLSVDDWKGVDIEFGEEPFLRSVLSEIRRQAGISSISVFRNLESEKTIERFEELINKLLDKGQIVQAIRLEYMFSQNTKNMMLIETCMKLAEGDLNPYQLNSQVRLLLKNFPESYRKQRTLSSLRLSSCSSTVSLSSSPMRDSVETAASNFDDIQNIIESLTQHVTRGTCIVARILCCSKIAESSGRPYARILANYDAALLLKTTLASDCSNKFMLANNIMKAHSWTKNQISEYLCSEIVSAITKNFTDVPSSEPITLWGYLLDSAIHIVLELCPEPSILGSSLLMHGSASVSSSSKIALSRAGELLIRAHDCFTADCNMEGISHILNRARTLVSNFSRFQAWAPMVRLLIGIGRYVEMDYVFQILEDNEQFEWLLGQGTANAKGLRRATMDYLRRNSPGKRELSRLVALRWGLHDSAAELWESEAKDIISNLVCVAKLEMQNAGKVLGPCGLLELNLSDGVTKKCLDNAVTCLTHAVQHHLLAVRYASAIRAMKLAELVALQNGLLTLAAPETTAVCILELNSDQVIYLINNKLEFSEARILIAYYNCPVDWGAVLYEQCVVKSRHEKYLPAFLSTLPLTDLIAKDVVRRYLADKKERFIPEGLKVLLTLVKSPSTKYRLASELGLRDMAQELLESSAGPYLRDTVWKSGCPAPKP